MVIAKGKGSFVWDGEGKQYLDFTSGISVCSLGHCHPRITEVIARQAGKLVHCSNYYINEHTPKLAQMLGERSFNGKFFFGNSGAEANEGMIKIARKWGFMNGDRHESSAWTTPSTDAHWQRLRRRGAPSTRRLRAMTCRASSSPTSTTSIVEKLINEKRSPYFWSGQGERRHPATKIHVGNPQTLRHPQPASSRDEIQCGMARTGTYFAYQRHGVAPDAMTIARRLPTDCRWDASSSAKLADVLKRKPRNIWRQSAYLGSRSRSPQHQGRAGHRQCPRAIPCLFSDEQDQEYERLHQGRQGGSDDRRRIGYGNG